MANDDPMTTAKPGAIDSAYEQSAQAVQDDSEDLLQKIKGKYQRKQERLEELKEQEKKIRAAQVFTKRRYREVTAVLKKGGNMVSEAAYSAQKESVRLLDKTKAHTRIFNLNARIEELLAQLGSEIYDVVSFGGTNVFDNANVKNVLSRINECHVEIELIQKMFKKKADKEDADGASEAK